MLRRLLPLLCLSVAMPVAFAAEPSLSWGEPEVIGLQKMPRETVLAKLPLRVGDPVEQKEKELLRWCDAIRGLPLAAVNCTGTVIGRRLHYVVEVVEDRDIALAFSPATGAPATARLPPEARQLLAHREYRVQEIAAEGFAPTERVTPSGVIIAEDSELRTFDVQLRDICTPVRDRLIGIVLDGRHPERQEAVQLLSWAGLPEESIERIHGRLLDPDREIRNLVGRFIITFADRVRDSELAEAVAQSFIAQLRIPTLTDRTKALGGLSQLLNRHPELRERIREQARGPLEAVARESVLPTIGGEAKGLLHALGGVQ